jgi:hypothetical protein
MIAKSVQVIASAYAQDQKSATKEWGNTDMCPQE